MRPSNRDVFLNCPFDQEYEPLFHAVCFTVIRCGFNPRSALEVTGAGESRLEKICRIISQCDFGIHDLSRTELNGSGLPRFNMPFELGLFFGCKRWGGAANRGKQLLILDRDQHRYLSFLSDLAGFDPEPHGASPRGAIGAVRNWLQGATGCAMRGPAYIDGDYQSLRHDLPVICANLGLDHFRIPFRDLMDLIHRWQREFDASLP